MRIVIALLAVAATGCGNDSDAPPVGGGTDGGGLFPDGSLIDSSQQQNSDAMDDALVQNGDAQSIMGRVCLAADPRKLNTCATSGAGGLTVQLGSATTLTADDGTFTIVGGSGNLWTVRGSSIVTSHMLIGDYEIPALATATYNAMISGNLMGLTLNPGEGSVMVQVIQNGFGIAGAFASSDPVSVWQPFYDGPDTQANTKFDQDATESNGVVWFAGIDVGTASITVTFGDDFVKSGLPIVDGHITFTTVIIP